MEIIEKICREMHDQLTRQEGVRSIKTVVVIDGQPPYEINTGRLEIGTVIVDGQLKEANDEPLV